MAKKSKRLAFRVTPEQQSDIAGWAQRTHMSVSQYLLRAGQSYSTDNDLAKRVSDLLDARLPEVVGALIDALKDATEQQRAAVGDAVKQVNDANAERDKALRDDLNKAFNSFRERLEADMGIDEAKADDAKAE